MFKRKKDGKPDFKVGGTFLKPVYQAHNPANIPPGATPTFNGHQCKDCGSRRNLYVLGKRVTCIRGYGCRG